ncbi:glycine N-acyltransferase-like protein 3 isoform X1 [Anguilla anguilla]|uniref:glycine N-acyltransferase-like protein 3 isoform X1 n=2 Tax=Anguilla anguilla TaxID=7936 RepID=UPI0015ABEB89|nr:glycine N-acyltransferase-like protein 3 isoform X1 [Anguilla anguilla]
MFRVTLGCIDKTWNGPGINREIVFKLSTNSEPRNEAICLSKSAVHTCKRCRMYVLGTEELKSAEHILRGSFPESLKVYGCLYNINRGKPYNWEVIADSWPDFRAIICKPTPQSRQDYQDREGDLNMCHIYAKDKESLQKLLGTSGLLEWSQFTLLAGVDSKHLDAVKELAARKNTPTKMGVGMFLMTLEDASHLKDPESDLASRLKPLTTAHAELVNSKWKHGSSKSSYNSIVSFISNYPSLCVTAEDGTPVSWLLLSHYCTLCLLYTSPEHRRKGHARLLVTTMARALLEQGRPVYTIVEEGNDPSYSLFTSLGFSHKPDFCPVWFQLNPR